jgi:hypothetical protein
MLKASTMGVENMNIGEISHVTQNKIQTFNKEAGQYRLAREGGWRQSWPGRIFIQVLIMVLGLAGK